MLFISNLKPYQGVTKTTLARWLLVCMDRAGIDTASYRANSLRSAGASSFRAKGMSLAQVLARGYWSSATRTFSIFYDRSGVDDSSGISFLLFNMSLSLLGLFGVLWVFCCALDQTVLWLSIYSYALPRSCRGCQCLVQGSSLS